MPNDKKNLDNLTIINLAASGYYGYKYINDTVATTPDSGYKFYCIVCLSEAVIAGMTGSTDLTGATLKDNAVITGRWSSLTLTSGEILAYQIPEDN